jgi:2-polyprenyl-6-methoxyphenol hydroxylase-like FAD-dependent oxidoreductase
MTRAVVLGAGMAGLLAARVLSEFYDEVTVVERDRLPDAPMQRRGIPQGRHLHSFLSRGCQLVEEFFPGIVNELVDAGANLVGDGDLSRVYMRTGAYELNRTEKFADPEDMVFFLASRPFVEFHVRTRVTAIPNVRILDCHDITAPTVIARDRVSGVLVADRTTGERTTLAADLIVDAMGRGARTPAFLDDLGYVRPQEQKSAANWGYSSLLLRLESGAIAEQMVLVDPGQGLPRAALLAYENDSWILTVGQMAADGEPPSDLAGMLTLASRCLPPTILAGLRSARPLGDAAIFRTTAGHWRRYDRMPDFPAGLLVIGDALCSLNPIYGQGMTMAALEAVALQEYLREGIENPQRFFRAAASHIGPVWAMNQARDRVPARTDRRRSVGSRLESWTMNTALKAAEHDIVLTERFIRVANLVDPPTRLRDPALLTRIISSSLRRRFSSSTRRSWCTTVRLARRRAVRAGAR